MRVTHILKTLLLVSSIALIHQSPLTGQNLPMQKSKLFSGSGNCAVCHRAGNGAFTTVSGTDKSPTELWRSSMMANSFKDPLWQAKVAAEVAAHPALQSVIEDKCTTCHAPMGRTEAIYNGAAQFSFSQAASDALSGDGVSCTLCHQIQKENFGKEAGFSGHYEILNHHTIFGPYPSPTVMPMLNQTGYSPAYSKHVHESELCATCHTLFTPFVNNQGQVAGYFPEQVPYLEWKNSIYSVEQKSCQSCHMLAVNEAMKITASPPWVTTLRYPIWQHDFVGANLFMNSLLTQFSNEIGVAASSGTLATTKSKTENILNQETVVLAIDGRIVADSLDIVVHIENLAGHKFPTGFPSRRAWLHLLVENRDNDNVFESGNWNHSGEIKGVDEPFEPHHQIVRDPNQVQIYQAIMQDVDAQVTHTLLRGAKYIKDNRIPPRGFDSNEEGYETVAIVGDAAVDPDFNRDEMGKEGTGADAVGYRIFIGNASGPFTITVELRYQTLSTAFAQDLFEYTAGSVTRFKNYYDAIDQEPILVKSTSKKILTTDIKSGNGSAPKAYGLLKNFPNPFNASTMIQYSILETVQLELGIYDLAGRKVKTLSRGMFVPGEYREKWDGTDSKRQPVPSGIYFICLQMNETRLLSRAMLLR